MAYKQHIINWIMAYKQQTWIRAYKQQTWIRAYKQHRNHGYGHIKTKQLIRAYKQQIRAYEWCQYCW